MNFMEGIHMNTMVQGLHADEHNVRYFTCFVHCEREFTFETAKELGFPNEGFKREFPQTQKGFKIVNIKFLICLAIM